MVYKLHAQKYTGNHHLRIFNPTYPECLSVQTATYSVVTTTSQCKHRNVIISHMSPRGVTTRRGWIWDHAHLHKAAGNTEVSVPQSSVGRAPALKAGGPGFNLQPWCTFWDISKFTHKNSSKDETPNVLN